MTLDRRKMEGDVDEGPIVVLPPDVNDDDILLARIHVPRKGGGHPFVARPPDIFEKEWLWYGSSIKGTQARRALADDCDMRRMRSIRGAQLRAGARANAQGHEVASEVPAAA